MHKQAFGIGRHGRHGPALTYHVIDSATHRGYVPWRYLTIDYERALMSAYAAAHLQSVAFGPDIVEYLRRIDATLAPYGGRFLVHGDPADVREGDFSGDLIVIEFPDRDHAVGWYESRAYREIVDLRTENSTGWVVLIDGVPADHRATDILDTSRVAK